MLCHWRKQSGWILKYRVKPLFLQLAADLFEPFQQLLLIYTESYHTPLVVVKFGPIWHEIVEFHRKNVLNYLRPAQLSTKYVLLSQFHPQLSHTVHNVISCHQDFSFEQSYYYISTIYISIISTIIHPYTTTVYADMYR